MLLPLLMNVNMMLGRSSAGRGRGYHYPLDRPPERKRHEEAIAPQAEAVIAKVAEQAAAARLDRHQRAELLMRELQIAEIAWQARYLDALRQTIEVRAAALQRHNDEALLLLMAAAAAV